MALASYSHGLLYFGKNSSVDICSQDALCVTLLFKRRFFLSELHASLSSAHFWLSDSGVGGPWGAINEGLHKRNPGENIRGKVNNKKYIRG